MNRKKCRPLKKRDGWELRSEERVILKRTKTVRRCGAISTEHISSFQLMVIGTNAHRVDCYLLHLTMKT